MTQLLWILSLAVAVAAAARSTYSPCGLSMLSSITPFGERGRGHRYRVTAAWFVAGALLGGSTLGAVAAAVAASTHAAGLAHHRLAVAAVGAVAAAAAASVDAGTFGAALPVLRRQVDDRWLARYRPWFYASGFGWQVGVGLATYVMTAGVVLVPILGAISGSPIEAFTAAAVFGTARGLTVLLTSAATDPAGLRALHRRLERALPAVHRATIGVQASTAAMLTVCATDLVSPAGAVWPALALVAAGAAVPAATVIVRPSHRPPARA